MEKRWWKEAIAYQIYPMSFYDTDGDGIGDIEGICRKLDYLKTLGVDVIWITPVCKSPNNDNGYDISDYFSIDEKYGTMEDFDLLLDEVHKRGMKLIIDLVVNHTSDEHPWFIESRSSVDNKKRDYYIWRKGKEGREPNNWESFFKTSTWEYDEKTDEYYLHLFSIKQPDLNWQNKEMKEEIFQMMKWWLDKDIDGFRLDAINRAIKPVGLPDSKNSPTHKDGYVFDKKLTANQEGIHEMLHEMNTKVFSRYDIMTVGEAGTMDAEMSKLYVSEDRKELDMVFGFEVVTMGEWDALKYKDILKRWYDVVKAGGWIAQYFGNHDLPRAVTMYGNDKEYREESAKMLAMLLLMLPGTPFIYQGDEIGMTNIKFDNIDQHNDIDTVSKYKKLLGEGVSKEKALETVRLKSRDNARTPMQWDNTENAGFSSSKPWLEINENYKSINVNDSFENKDSILNFYIQLIKLRKSSKVPVYGNFEIILEDNPEIVAFKREYKGKTWLVITNFSERHADFILPGEIKNTDYELLASNISISGRTDIKSFKMKPYEARIYRI